MIPLEEAIEVFVHAFSKSKSRTHPYLLDRIGDLWVMRDAPGRKNPRKIEVIAHESEPALVAKTIRENGIGWHFVCDVVGLNAELNDRKLQYKELGYRALATEWMYAHSLRKIPTFDCDPAVRLVSGPEDFSTIPQHTSQKRKFDFEVRQYCVWDSSRAYGWVHSRPYLLNSWVGDLFVDQEMRGRGYGRALMSRLLRDDQKAGVSHSVLLASASGARLYPHLGYELIGTLQIYCPRLR